MSRVGVVSPIPRVFFHVFCCLHKDMFETSTKIMNFKIPPYKHNKGMVSIFYSPSFTTNYLFNSFRHAVYGLVNVIS